MAEVTVSQASIIRVMPEVLANKIAAGEVVRRPASVVKELLENAIDAGAREITINIKGAGSGLIQVVDDGCGMGPQDAELSFVRHATSKIRTLDDLDSIRTLGFRGEALASIGAVSQCSLRTRRKEDDAGTEVIMEGGRRVSSAPYGMIPGTSISVRNLFFNVPARRKFLKRPATELKHIVDSVQVIALSNPSIGFRLLNEEHELLHARTQEGLSNLDALRIRLSDLLSIDDPSLLFECTESTSYLSVSGFLGAPRTHRRHRGRQFLFINGRAVRHRYMEHAVLSAYEYLIPEGTWPSFALFLQIDPRHVDVNVHPTKDEVKFDDEHGVYGMLRTMARKALGSSVRIPDFSAARPAEGVSLNLDTRGAEVPGLDLRSGGATEVGGGKVNTLDLPTGYPPPGQAADLREPFAGNRGAASATLYDVSRGIPSRHAGGATEWEDASADLLWQLHDAYILTQIRSGLVIVDQQAAHERVLYERAMHSLADGFGLSQQLLFPRTVEFCPSDFVLLQELLPDLGSLGFDVEPFGGRTVIVRGVPADIRSGDERSLLDEVLDQYKRFSNVEVLSVKENLARSIARRSAVRAGTRMSHKEMRALIDQLFQCEYPLVSPDGRSTIIQLSVDELRGRFSRKG